MRNVFDQYVHFENKLSHALLYSLGSDPLLLRRFIKWTAVDQEPYGRVSVFEQQLPGEKATSSEDEAMERGLPDGCLCDGSGWGLIIESKVAASADRAQIRRHVSTLIRRGFREPHVLWLTVLPVAGRLPRRCINRTWPQLYEWLLTQIPSSIWARHAARYFEVFETQCIDQQYLREGKLTRFAGIPFSATNPYSYLEAKRLLGLLRDELLKDKALHRQLHADPDGEGRGAITGRSGSFVWDYISLREARGADAFTRFPHLTIGIHDDSANAYVTFPNGLRPSFRNGLSGEDFDEFRDLVQQVARRLVRVLGKEKSAVPQLVVLQRHYPSQRSAGIVDALLQFDLRTAFPELARASGVLGEPEWLRAAYRAFRSKKGNLQMQIGATFPYGTCRTVASGRLVELISRCWIACRPMIVRAVGDRG
jgi:hypothetical protein